MKKDRWPVILADTFRERVAQGWPVLVVCVESAERSGSTWVGQWQFFVQSPEGDERLKLVLRKNIEPRTALSAYGVISFLAEFGFDTAAIPLVEGQIVALKGKEMVNMDSDG